MKFQPASSKRIIESLTDTTFSITQDRKQKTITILTYQGMHTVNEIIFLNGIEAILDKRGRYVNASTTKEFCARIVTDEEIAQMAAKEAEKKAKLEEAKAAAEV
jgi:hypothetical protein